LSKGLLCSHSSPTEETVTAGYSGEYLENYSAISNDCGCGCGVAETVGLDNTETIYSEASSTSVADSDRYLIGAPIENTGSEPTPATDSAVEAIGTKVQDVVQPPAELAKPFEASLEGNLLP
jgi:hypothetical protein